MSSIPATSGDDPGDWALLARAGAEDRILVTLDTDFAALIYVQAGPMPDWFACRTCRRINALP